MPARKGTLLAVRKFLILLAGWSSPAFASHHGWAVASGIGRDLVVGAAIGVPAVQGDWPGDLQAVGSIGLAEGGSLALKAIIHERRPDGSDDKSFPSGHASLSFGAAATLENRYGWKAGLPAFAVASFVGAARVAANKHHWWDAVAGAALGTGSGLLVTRRHDPDVRLLPWAGAGGGGLAFAARF